MRLAFTNHSLNQISIHRKTVTRRTSGLVKVNICPNAWELDTFRENPGYDDRGVLVARFKNIETHSIVVCRSKYQQGQRLFYGNAHPLEIMSIEVGQVQNVNNEEAVLEGAASPLEFARIWDEIYSQHGYHWARNPWAWRYRFRIIP